MLMCIMVSLPGHTNPDKKAQLYAEMWLLSLQQQEETPKNHLRF